MPTGAIPVTAPGGIAISVTPGATYNIRNTGGPWYASGVTQPHYFYSLSADGLTWYGPIGEGSLVLPPWATGSALIDYNHVVVTFTGPSTSSIRIRVFDNPTQYADNGGSMGYDLESGVVSYCEYGFGIGPSTSFQAVTIGLELVGAVAAFFAAPWMIPFLLVTIGLELEVGALCGGPPPTPPPLRDIGTWSPQDGLQWMKAALWQQWCVCTPATGGAPDPVLPPTPTPIPPGGTTAPVYTPVACDESSLCRMVDMLSQQVGALQQQFAVVTPLVTLIQRQAVPFGYLFGVLHTGLSGNGSIDVQGLVAVIVELTTIPGYTGEESGVPLALFDIGWIAAGPPDGWRSSHAIRHNPFWVPLEGDDTQVGYSLTTGVIANIQEVRREP